jgi:hypothetical protein
MESFSSQARQSGYPPAAEPKSQGNEPHTLVFVFFAFFAVNLDYSFQVHSTVIAKMSGTDSAEPPLNSMVWTISL